MFHHLIVPLDGSSRAEEALPLAAHIARHTGGTLSLLRVVPPEEGIDSSPYYSRAGVLAGEVHEILTQGAKEYLEHVSQVDLLAGIPLRTQVLRDPPAQAILNYAQSEHADLIVLCSHGYTGLKRWALGSVAQKIARHSLIPVVILPERSSQSPLYHPEKALPVRALVALDGSPLAETTLLPTAQLVTALGPSATPGELHLIRVIKPPSDLEVRKYMKYYDVNLEHLNHIEVESYLHTTKDRLTQELTAFPGLQVTFSYVEDADIATALIRSAQKSDDPSSHSYDLIALATHGRSGIKRWMVGSITERVLEEAKMPLLIVRPDMPTLPSLSSDEMPHD